MDHDSDDLFHARWEASAELVAYLVDPCLERGLQCELQANPGNEGVAVIMRRLP